MTTQIKRRRGTAAEHSTFTGAEGELTVNTTNESVHVHDGSTAGGFELARADGSNLAMGSNLTFGDNDKAIFGAGSDLQIYHNGTDSFVDDAGGGWLRLRGDNSVVIGSTNGESYIKGTVNGAAELYYDNSSKLATTSTGIDVTGTVTSDSLLISSSDPKISFIDTDTGADSRITANSSNGRLTIDADLNDESAYSNISLRVDGKNVQLLSSGGDISFYEDTGTTAKFHWDASTERLGIGTSIPGYSFHITNTGTQSVYLNRTDASVSGSLRLSDANSTLDIYGTGAKPMTFGTNNTERMRIDSSGNVGIGTTPASWNSSYTGLQVGGMASLTSYYTGGDANAMVLSGNAYFSNSGWNYIADEQAAQMLMVDGHTIFKTAGSSAGTADAAITWAETMRINSGGNVGIGTSSPASDVGVSKVLEVEGSTAGLKMTSTGGASMEMYAAPTVGYIETTTSSPMIFRINSTERMRIDSSGNLLVGKTSPGSGSQGVEAKADGALYATRSLSSGSQVGIFNRLTSDGDLVSFRKDGTTVGSIGTLSGYFHFVGATNGIRSVASRIQPCTSTGGNADNIMDLGYSTVRWDDIYATNGTIQTSDEREKQDIDVLSDAEHNVAVAAKGLIRKYRWKDAVAEKGDDARIHFGVIAQDLKAAFEAEGLDAGRYAMFIHTEWWETYTDVPAVEAKDAVLDDDGNVIEEAVEAKDAYTRTDTYDTEAEAPEGAVKKDRMGVRYPELLAFIIGAL